MKTNTNEKKSIAAILESKCEEVKLGVDMHARYLVVSVQLAAAVADSAERQNRHAGTGE